MTEPSENTATRPISVAELLAKEEIVVTETGCELISVPFPREL